MADVDLRPSDETIAAHDEPSHHIDRSTSPQIIDTVATSNISGSNLAALSFQQSASSAIGTPQLENPSNQHVDLRFDLADRPFSRRQ